MSQTRKIVGGTPRSTVSQLKQLSDAVKNIITTIELDQNKKLIYAKYSMRPHGKMEATIARLLENSGIEGSNRTVMMDSYFENMLCYK